MNTTLYDPLRRKSIARTPEEEVRQGLIQWFHQEKGVPLNWMMSEYGFRCGQMSYRADLVIFGKDLKPVLLAECKAPSVPIDRTVLEQGLRYNRILQVKYMVFTNGKVTYVVRLDPETNAFVFEETCPNYPELIKTL